MLSPLETFPFHYLSSVFNKVHRSLNKLVSSFYFNLSSVQLLSHVRLFVNPWTAAHQASLSITNSVNFFRLMSIKSVMPCNHLIHRCPLFLLPSIFSCIRVFSKKLVLCIRWPKYWSFSSHQSFQ